MKQKHLVLLCSLLLLSVFSLRAQEENGTVNGQPEQWNIKSNLLYDLTGTVNLGAEFQLNERWTMDISGNYNGWEWSHDRKWKHWMIQPEARLWTRQTMKGHFFALHALGGEYNVGKLHLPFGLFKELRTLRHEGWYLGAGIGYGHRWNLSPRWGIEAEAALGYIHFNYRKYECATCGERLGTGVRNYIGPTKLAFNLIYRFGKKPARRPPVIETVVARPDTVETVVEVVRRDTVKVVNTPPEPRIISRSEDLRLRYRQGNADILPSFASNAAELSRAMTMIDEIKNDPTVDIKRIVMTGYASPEGNETSNMRLSSARAAALRDYLSQQLPAFAHLIVAVPGGEDWNGLEQAVGKDLLVPARNRVLDAVADAKMGRVADAKSRLKGIAGGEAYRYLLNEVYPRLRRVECRVEYTRKEEGGK